MSLVTDNEEILNQKDIEWSSKFISTTEPDPISNQSKLPVEKQEESQQPRRLKSIQVFIRLVVLISEKKIPLVNDTM